MDPFGITIALALFGGSLLSRSARKEAEQEYNGAASEYRSAETKFRTEYSKCTKQCNSLAVNRIACVVWQIPHINSAAARLGVQDKFFGHRNSVFGGRTLTQLLALVRAARQAITPAVGCLDRTVMMASGGALVLKGVQHLDKVGLMHAPLLDSNLHDLVSSLPFEHAHGMADALGGAGGLGVADLVGDGLIVFSLVKTGYNLVRAGTLEGKASDVRTQAAKVREATARICLLSKRVGGLSKDLEESSYCAFKAALVAEEAARLGALRREWRIPTWVADGLREASARLWNCMQRPATV